MFGKLKSQHLRVRKNFEIKQGSYLLLLISKKQSTVLPSRLDSPITMNVNPY